MVKMEPLWYDFICLFVFGYISNYIIILLSPDSILCIIFEISYKIEQ